MTRTWIADRLQDIGSSQADLGRALSLPSSRVSEIIGGRREIKLSEIAPLAQALKMTIQEAMGRLGAGAHDAPTVPLVGRVGAGGDITRIDTIVDYVDLPPGADGPLEALEVAGESMLPEIQTGDLLFYDPTAPTDPRDLLYRLVVLETEDGRLFVKTLRLGAEPDTFDLISYAEGKRENVRVKSAAKVLFQDRRGRR